MTLGWIDEAEIVAHLDAIEPSQWLVATDADGTLWRGDVGDDVWTALTDADLLSEESAPASRALADAAGLSGEGDATDVSARLLDAYHHGTLDDHAAFTAAALSLSGHDLDDMVRRIDDALVAARVRERTHPEMRRIVAAARARGVEVFVVSASSRIVVERALRLAEIDVTGVIGVELASRGGHLSPALAAEVPYRAGKARLLRARVGDRGVLHAFGDSPFDADLLRMAKVPVAVEPKPRLRAAGVDGLRELRLAR